MESIIGMLVSLGESLEKDSDYLKWELDSHRLVLSTIHSRKTNAARLTMEKHIKEVSEFHSRLNRSQEGRRV
jgi:DNA-binding FadR family transcriptional regulator